MSSDLVEAVKASAGRLGVSPHDILTIMSYETGGRLDPNLWGGKNGNHLGLIQFGGPEREKYGVRPGMAVGDQVLAAENFLRDRGVRPGMGLLDLYSTVNAGRPGLYDRSDAANGGAPGTVRDKVANQMVGHRLRAEALLGGRAMPAAPSVASPAAPGTIPGTGGVPFSLAPPTEAGAAGGLDATTLAALQQIAKLAEDDGGVQVAPQPINYYRPGGVPRAMSRSVAR